MDLLLPLRMLQVILDIRLKNGPFRGRSLATVPYRSATTE
jgi:hypothetical protein